MLSKGIFIVYALTVVKFINYLTKANNRTTFNNGLKAMVYTEFVKTTVESYSVNKNGKEQFFFIKFKIHSTSFH